MLIGRLLTGGPPTEGVARVPPALRGLHFAGAVGRRAVPEELGELSLFRVLLQEALDLGGRRDEERGDGCGGSAMLWWHHGGTVL